MKPLTEMILQALWVHRSI